MKPGWNQAPGGPYAFITLENAKCDGEHCFFHAIVDVYGGTELHLIARHRDFPCRQLCGKHHWVLIGELHNVGDKFWWRF